LLTVDLLSAKPTRKGKSLSFLAETLESQLPTEGQTFPMVTQPQYYGVEEESTVMGNES
jgi:hypothetical protein